MLEFNLTVAPTTPLYQIDLVVRGLYGAGDTFLDCRKTVVVPRSERVALDQIGATCDSRNPLRNIVE
jgi:hypothetical protein